MPGSLGQVAGGSGQKLEDREADPVEVCREATLWRPRRGCEGRGGQEVGLEDRDFSALYISRCVSALIIPH